MLLFNFEKVTQYSNMTHLYAIAILGLIFIILGWLLSRLLRPSGRLVQERLQDVKKELLDELNTSKKFNAEHRHLIEKEADRMQQSIEVE